MSGYQVTQIGALDQWRDHFGGFDETRSRDGRRVVDHELAMQYIGMTANALKPGEEAGYWRARPDSAEELRWLCIRAGGEQLPQLPNDSTRAPERPMPWPAS